jgi:enediyne biosynthesis protein E4
MNAPARPRSRREKRLAQTGGVAVLLLIIAGVWVARVLAPEAGYVPGDPLEGLTSELLRDLPDDRPPITFSEVTAAAGIEFSHFDGVRASQIVEDMGSGAAWGDFDGDGWPDLFLVNSGPLASEDTEGSQPVNRSQLYRNLGDGTFRELGEEAGVAVTGIGMGAAWADFDNDGNLDLVVSGYPRLHLFRNQGNGRFEDVSQASGLEAFEGFWAGVTWGDYDRDGLLDLYVTGYVQYEPQLGASSSSQYEAEVPASLNPSAFEAARNLLFHNDGRGRFTERAAAAGVLDESGRGLSAAWVDLNADAWPDLYVANDVSDNALFVNQTDGTFINVSHPSLVADYRGAMGIAVGDWDGDQDLDLFLTHWIAQENALYSNLLNQLSTPEDPERRLQFRDDADRFGLGQIALDYVGWATSFLDFDNDGRLDLFVVNGSTFQQDDDPRKLIGMRDQLFWNAGRKRGFFDIGPALGPYFMEEHVGRGGAAADYDQDGDLDLFIVNHSGAGVLLRNDGEHGAWLQVDLRGTTSNRDGFGTEVEIYSADSIIGFEQKGAQSSYLSQNDGTLHFGLGPLSQADSVVVTWPDGFRQSVEETPANGRLLVIQRGGSEWSAPTPAMSERDRVTAFWEAFRGAARARIAGDHVKALEGYRLASSLDPGHLDALYYRGHMARDLGFFEEAEEAWSTLVEANPLSARGFNELGWLYLCTEAGAPSDPAAAQKDLVAAMEINPEHTGAWIDASVAALAVGDSSRAREWLEHAKLTDPDGPGVRFLDAYLTWKTGNLTLALQIVNRGSSTAPQEVPGTSEGDTKEGGAMVAEQARCNELRRFTRGVRQPADGLVFAAFDSLLGAVAGRR